MPLLVLRQLTGSWVQASEAASKHRLELRRRGVSLVCVETKSSDPGAALKSLKAEFGYDPPGVLVSWALLNMLLEPLRLRCAPEDQVV